MKLVNIITAVIILAIIALAFINLPAKSYQIHKTRSGDFILVDDTDYLSESIIKYIKNIRVKKIIACTILDNTGFDKKDTYKINTVYNESKLKESFTIEYSDKYLNIENLEEFYTQVIRDEKLTKILNEK